MHKLTITRVAEAFSDPRAKEKITDHSTLAGLQGIHTDDSCLDEHNQFAAQGVEGGRIIFKWDDHSEQLLVSTSYRMPSKIDKEHEKKLVDLTLAQWSDGIGNGSFIDHGPLHLENKYLSTALSMAILNSEPSASGLGAVFLDAYPMAGGEPRSAWSEGLEFDDDLIVELVRRAKNNDPKAATRLALCYLQGECVKADPAKSVPLLLQAVSLDFPMSMGILADLYEEGIGGLERNMEKRFEMFKRGAELQDPICQHELGKCYEEGQGVKQDLNEALKFYQLSNALGESSEEDIARVKAALE